MRAFRTGSTVYGLPTKKSDIDLVVYIDGETAAHLLAKSDDTCVIRFGKLNIIPVDTEDKWQAWKTARDLCLQDYLDNGPVSKERAIAIHHEVADKMGLDARTVFDDFSGP